MCIALNYNLRLRLASPETLRLPIPSFAALTAVLIAALVALPVFVVGSNLFFGGTGDTWAHLLATVLPEYVVNTVWLCLGVGAGVMAVGVGAAWLTAMHDFPGRRIFEWALVIPLAMPAYVMAYTYTDLLQFVGPVQTWLRMHRSGRSKLNAGVAARKLSDLIWDAIAIPPVKRKLK